MTIDEQGDQVNEPWSQGQIKVNKLINCTEYQYMWGGIEELFTRKGLNWFTGFHIYTHYSVSK